jgi:CBS domain containing-hemolysin-like protein
MVLGLLVLLVAGLLVVVFALFEIAFFASSPIAVRALGESVEEARTLRERLADPLVVLIPARVGLVTAAVLFGFALDRLGLGATGIVWSAGVFVPAWFLLRELVPAAILLRDPEDVLRPLLPWFGRWERIVRPLTGPVRTLLRRGFPLPSEPDDDASDEEVEAFLETGEEEGILEEEEAAMVRGVLELDEMLVREVMTPRPSVVSVSDDAPRREVERLVAESRHHRIPVFGAADQVVGVVDAVDLVAAPGEGEGVTPLLRAVPVVPETKRVDDLLREFKLSKQTFAVVVDEHASVSGIVTLRDISEEIVGEVHEEGEPVEEDLVREAEGVYRVRGGAELDDVARITGLTLPDSLNGAAFDTVSGFALAAFRKIPAPGEAMEQGGLRIEILDADERRIHRVRLARVGGID